MRNDYMTIIYSWLKKFNGLGILEHALNPILGGRWMSMSLRPTWSIEQVPGPHTETLSQNKKQQTKKCYDMDACWHNKSTHMFLNEF